MSIVTLNNQRSFQAEPNVSILDAARAGGIALEYSCRTGRCGICKAPVIAGETEILRPEECLTADEQASGVILTCCRAAKSDVALDVEDLDRLVGIEAKTMPCRIVSIETVAPDIAHVVLRTPPTSPLKFLPGQYIDILATGTRRSYSLANAPRPDGLLELFVRKYEGGVMSKFWFETAKPNDLIRLEGPFGTFFLRQPIPANIVFLATGTGIAPVKALLEEIARSYEQTTRPRLRVYWGNRHSDSFIWSPEKLGLDLQMDRLLSGADRLWGGKRGYVQEAAIEDGVAPEDTAVYACGSNGMITAAKDAFEALGLAKRRFLSDAFVSSN